MYERPFSGGLQAVTAADEDASEAAATAQAEPILQMCFPIMATSCDNDETWSLIFSYHISRIRIGGPDVAPRPVEFSARKRIASQYL